METANFHSISVIWRGKKFVVEMNLGATIKDLGQELQKLTCVQEDTMRLIVPQDKSSKLVSPFYVEHALLSLQETSITEGKLIRMMGVSKNEVEEVLEQGKANLRIAGFDEEDKRLKQRISDGFHFSLKLPKGPYTIVEFQTLEIPGIQLNPPTSEALKRMHMLAADPGVVAVMNKHHWRVGVMTEMAPVGYVGVTPKCILGFNKNHGEEISLRLRTDDLTGFRKYESIKKTLLHELAHMVYSEHDANFYALDKKLNQEAAILDWTRSRSYTLSGSRDSKSFSSDYVSDNNNLPRKIGGNKSDQHASAPASSVLAAYHRISDVSANNMGGYEVHKEPDPDDSGFSISEKSDKIRPSANGNAETYMQSFFEPDPDDHSDQHASARASSVLAAYHRISDVSANNMGGYEVHKEPDPDDSGFSISEKSDKIRPSEKGNAETYMQSFLEPDPDVHSDLNAHEPYPDDHMDYLKKYEPEADDSLHNNALGCKCSKLGPEFGKSSAMQKPDFRDSEEPDPDDLETSLESSAAIENFHSSELDNDESKISGLKAKEKILGQTKDTGPDLTDSTEKIDVGDKVNQNSSYRVPVCYKSHETYSGGIKISGELSRVQVDEPDRDDQELRRIHDPVTVFCSRLQRLFEILRAEAGPLEATSIFQTLLKIVRNVIEHPDETKYRRLRKANPIIRRHIANYKAAMDILLLSGFSEVVSDEVGKAETHLVLKRNDPGLLWLAKSSLETCFE